MGTNNYGRLTLIDGAPIGQEGPARTGSFVAGASLRMGLDVPSDTGSEGLQQAVIHRRGTILAVSYTEPNVIRAIRTVLCI